MPKILAKPGSVLTLVLSLMVGGSLVSAIYWSTKAEHLTSKRILLPTNSDLEITLRRVGLDPEHLAAAGLTTGEVSTLVTNARTSLTSSFESLSAADASYAGAKSSHDQLGRIVRSGLATPQELIDFNAAKTNMTAAASSRQAIFDGFSDAAVAGLNQAKQTSLATLTANGSWKMPVQYRAANRSETDWLTLRNALANDRISSERGENTDSTLHQFLLDTNANNAVAAAQSNRDNNLDSITSTFNSGVYGQ